MKVIGLTGGIGSGKSVVSRVLRDLGFPVYDSDAEAKRLMDADTSIHKKLCEAIHPAAVVDGSLDRPLISKIVFSDREALGRLNAIVHGAVIDDFKQWVSRKCGFDAVFVESAILFDCDLRRLVDEAWIVNAPLETRIRRVMSRNGMSRAEVLGRISSQTEPSAVTGDISIHIIYNDDTRAVLPQIEDTLGC